MKFDYRTISVIVAVVLAFVVRWSILRMGHKEAESRGRPDTNGNGKNQGRRRP